VTLRGLGLSGQSVVAGQEKLGRFCARAREIERTEVVSSGMEMEMRISVSDRTVDAEDMCGRLFGNFRYDAGRYIEVGRRPWTKVSLRVPQSCGKATLCKISSDELHMLCC
jgi:hypothetical protein